MDVRNCIKCGKIFNYIRGISVCPTCKNKLEEQFQVTKKFIRDNPGATIVDVSESCEVPIKLIHQWVREERLLFAEGSAIGIECELCGKTIRTGRYCEKCKNDVQHNLGGAYERDNSKDQFHKGKEVNKMRYLKRD